jgi:iron complex outermembrane receptor protein
LGASAAFAADTAASGPADETSDLQTVMVTAQRRAERVEDVPFTVDALSGAQLENARVTDIQSLAAVTSSVVMGNGGANVQPAIRGISSYGTGPGEAANVAIYLDGVYQPIQKANFFELVDIDRVEVLKGPQGTLFGANATGGAIRIFTREPTRTPTGKFELGYGNYDSLRGSLFLAGPLVHDVLLGSITGVYRDQQGYSKDLVRGGQFGTFRSEDIRAKLKFVGSDWLQAELIGLQFDRKNPNQYAGTVLNGNTLAVAIDPTALYSSRPWQTAQNEVGFGDSKGHQIALSTAADFSSIRITNLVSYQSSTNDIISDIDYSAVPLVIVGLKEENRTITEELQISSKSQGPFGWTVGYFYFHNKTDDHEQLNHAEADPNSNFYVRERARTHAVFGELTYAFTDRLTGILGARYSNEWTSAFAAVGTPVTPMLGEKSWRSTTPRASLRYAVTPSANVYATFSKGFKSGLFGGFDFATTPVDPEKVDAYEVGVKSLLGRTAEINGAAYFYNYKDQQFSQYNGLFFVYRNAASSHIWGLETSGALHLAQDLDVRFGASYNHANYASFPGAPAQVPTGFGGNMPAAPDLSGKPMARAPRWTGNIGLNYVVHIAQTVTNASINAVVSDKYYFEPSYRIVQPAYGKINAQLDFKASRDSHLDFRLWAQNLTNVAVKEAPIIISLGDFINYAPPRTYGVSVGYQF